MPLEGCPPQPGAPAVAGRLLERSKGKDTTTGHWELMGVVTPTAMPTYPHGFPHDVIDPFMHKTGRGVLGNRPASGTEIIQELGEEHQRTGKWIVYTSADSVFQIAAHEETIPLEELYEACRAAREILTGKHAVGRVIARPFAGEPGSYERTPNRHDFSLEPRRPNYLSLVRDTGQKVHAVGKISDIFAGCDIDESFPTKSNVDGINKTVELLQQLDDGFVFVEPRRDRPALGPPERPGQLPSLPAGLRPAARGDPRGAAARRPARHHLRPWLRPDDAVDRPLARARAPPCLCRRPQRAGRRARGGIRRRRGDRERVARGQAARTRHPGPSDHRPVKLDNPLVVQWEYASEERLAKRNQTYRELTEGVSPDDAVFEAVREAAPERVPRRGLRDGGARGARSEGARRPGRRRRHLAADGRADQRPAGSTRAWPTSRAFRSPTGNSTASPRTGCSTTCPISICGLSELERVIRRGGRLVAATLGDANMQELWTSSAGR